MRLAQALRPFALRRVRWKIMLPFVVLTALFAIFATRNITGLVTSSLEERLSKQLVSASQQTADAVAKREREHLEIVRAVSFTEGVGEAVQARDQRRIEALVLPTAANTWVESVEVFDRSGLNLYNYQRPGDDSASTSLSERFAPAEWTAAWAALAGDSDARGDQWAQIGPTAQGPGLLTAAPIEDDSGNLVGVVVVSTRLETILRDSKRNAFADVTTFDRGSIVHSTFDIGDADGANGFLRGTGETSEVGSVGRGAVLGRQYQFLNSELRVRGEAVGSVSVALPVDAVTSAGRTTQLRMSIIFGAITLAVMVIGWMIAKHLTSPLGRLVTAASAVSKGDLSARSNVRTNDEIGMLGVSFDAMAERLEQQHVATIGALASAIDARDPYTAGHSVRVGDLSFELGAHLGLPKVALHHLRVGGLLHDIGKIGVRDAVLLKPGALTPEERALIQEHPTIGLRILESARLPREVLEIVGGHHERLNGNGYPLGLSKEELSVFPRIAAVADMYDAMTTRRPYRGALSPQEALRILWSDTESGLLDPEVVAAMRSIARLWEERRASEGLLTKAWLDSLQAVRSSTVEAA